MRYLTVGALSNAEIPGVEAKALFATVDGTIGIVAALSEDKFIVLEKVEKRMEDQDMSLGGLHHSKYIQAIHKLRVDGVLSRMDGRRRRSQKGSLMGISCRDF